MFALSDALFDSSRRRIAPALETNELADDGLVKVRSFQLPQEGAVAFVPTLDLIGGAIKAEDDELAVNPRSRSAVLRVAEKRELVIGDSELVKGKSAGSSRITNHESPITAASEKQP